MTWTRPSRSMCGPVSAITTRRTAPWSPKRSDARSNWPNRYDLEVRLVSAKGVPKWVRTSGRPVMEGGRVVKVQGALQDITERKHMELELRASEERFRSIFEQAGVGVVEVDTTSGRILKANRRFCEFSATARRNCLRQTFQDVTHPDERDRDSGQVNRMEAGQLPEYAVEKRYLRKDGCHRVGGAHGPAAAGARRRVAPGGEHRGGHHRPQARRGGSPAVDRHAGAAGAERTAELQAPTRNWNVSPTRSPTTSGRRSWPWRIQPSSGRFGAPTPEQPTWS